MHRPCIVLGIVLLLLGDSTAEADGTREAIAAASRAFSAAYVTQDLATLGNLYTANARLLPPGGDVVGRAAIQKYFTLGANRRQIAHSMASESLTIHGSTAVDVGTWSSTSQRGEDEPATVSGRYLIVWVQTDDGAWRISHDMWHRPQ